MPVSRQRLMAQKAAEILAVQALAFIAQDPERLGKFLAATGIGPAEIREAAREPHFLTGVLDYLAADEALLVAFAGDAGFEPSTVARAREVLADMPWERDVP